MQINKITSDVSLINIEQHFRVSAGSGAGKTHWLVEHIKNVLHRSERLAKTRKVACITYTNIAVETILERLGSSADKVEVSTIHSFLYRYIVKPYASFIANEYGLNFAEMDGHDDIILSNYSFLNDWKTRTQQQRARNNNEIVMAITKARWKFDKDDLIFKPDYPVKVDGYALKNNSYLEYKKMSWERGVLHHDDVLFFSYKIIQRHPFVLKVLQKQFPYFFIDEFQDTNPIQTEILNKIGEFETIIGVIGDQAQSIYGFQGAKPEQFSSFSLQNIVEYQMLENRRSTNEIIDILNKIRIDIKQEKYNNKNGEKTVIFIGKMNIAFNKATEVCCNQPVYSLSRENILSNAMKKQINGVSLNSNLFNELLDDDKPSTSNKYRGKVIVACIKATELAREGKFKDAIKELDRIFQDKNDKEKGKKEALKHLQTLLKNHAKFKDHTLYEFYELIKLQIKTDISSLSTGKAKIFYEKHNYQELALCVKISDDTSMHKTIHKAKGDEFDNVLLVLKEESDLSFLLKPDLIKNEEHRINYVAVSRAKKRLFISVPSLSELNRKKLENTFQFTFENE